MQGSPSAGIERLVWEHTHLSMSALAVCSSSRRVWIWKGCQKLSEGSYSHGFDGTRRCVLSCTSSVGTVAQGCTHSPAHPNISSTACALTVSAQAELVPIQPHSGRTPVLFPPAPQEDALTLHHQNTRPAASVELPAPWGVCCCPYHLSGTETQAVRLSYTNRLPVTQDQVGIQTCKAPRQQPDPCSGVCSQAVAPTAPPKKGNS